MGAHVGLLRSKDSNAAVTIRDRATQKALEGARGVWHTNKLSVHFFAR